jgi:hypothetical protein
MLAASNRRPNFVLPLLAYPDLRVVPKGYPPFANQGREGGFKVIPPAPVVVAVTNEDLVAHIELPAIRTLKSISAHIRDPARSVRPN